MRQSLFQNPSDVCVDGYELKLNGSSTNFTDNSVNVNVQPGVYLLSINTRLADGHVTPSWSQIYTTEPGEYINL